MRDIKFRAWNEKKNEMVQDEQLVFWNGNIYRNESGTLNDPDKPHKPATLKGYSVMRDKVMQYTGLRDLNDREIWEGDIIEFNNSGKTCVVEWLNDAGCWTIGDRLLLGRASRMGKVVGNIYQHPHLLESSPSENHTVK